jgi:hypothetical protein
MGGDSGQVSTLVQTEGQLYGGLEVSFFKGKFRYDTCFKRWGARGSVVVKALCYKPEGRGFKYR